MDPRPPSGRAAGLTAVELLVVTAMLAVMAVFALPQLTTILARQQIGSAVAIVQGSVNQARMSALKEKVAHRVLVHDEAATTPNRLEVQREESGSFVTVGSESRAQADDPRGEERQS